jgi:nicotinamide-nucleotide amidase
MDADFTERVTRLARALTGRGETLATAESCTGGWVAKVCTDLAGSSAWFERGFVTYSNASKQDLLGVAPTTLEDHGAVSEQTVLEMVAGVLRTTPSHWAVAISGVAGPGGGSPDKPVGTVWIAGAGPTGWRTARCLHLDGDREAVRRQAVRAVLDMLLEELGDAGDGD